ncbi:MAG: SpaA isopeptide-forming pilin-related protein [Sharpea porci]|uniref:SpaA isopeptide-forming pilin-related protein n=1 Tax=Sharpea porci TaxID=2652286 RepID=UPI00240A6AD3|nr:SpaA isopeptide-forming pilin-related protein [Sharpea porci]MDD6711359.1 SpaA isopeptide-forming pilin-related protein [Sharpea porci]
MMNKMKRFLNQPIDTPLKRFVSLFVAMAMVLSVLTVTSLSTTTPASAAGGETSYKVTNDSKGSIDLTIKHLNNNSEFYTADHQTLQPGDFIDNYNKVKNYNVTSVTLDNKTVSNPQDLRLTTAVSHTIVVNYQASTSNVINPVKFYDYTLHPDDKTNSFIGGINDPANYSGGTTDTFSRWDNTLTSRGNRFAIGNNSIQYNNKTRYSGFYDVNGNKFVEMNNWTGGTAGKDDRLGIITNLSGNNYSQVNFNSAIYAPKLFNNDKDITVKGLTNIDNYKLNFSRRGDTYTLTKVLNEKGENANPSYTGSSNFFPLNHASSVKNNGEDRENRTNNVYFGMRYDFTFTLGDYNGPLNYTFNGDDDLWVFLDGQLVLDDGGIHGAIEKSVNIKEKLGSSPDKSAVHQITVLYMERGGNESNCSMEFTIPNLTPINYQEAQKIDVEFRKQNAHQEALAGAKFSVVDDNKVSLGEFTSNNNGTVTLNDLRVGTYYVTETKAPEGYVLTGNVQYKIVVSRTNDGKLTYKLYQPGENNTWSELSKNTIINKSEKEVEQESIFANKTAKLVTYTDGTDAWDTRFYDITLNPVSKKKITTTETTTTPGQDEVTANAMLVLDVSGSMVLGDKLGTLGYDNYYGYGYYAGDYTLDTTKKYVISLTRSTLGIVTYKNRRWQVTNSEGRVSNLSNYTGNTIYDYKDSLDQLKTASKNFISTLAAKSPKSKVGIATYSSTLKATKPLTTLTNENVSELNEFIDSLFAEGGTSPNLGLNYANTQLNAVTNENVLKYALLFTDGQPTGNSSEWNDDVEQASYTAANRIKNYAKIYTVGLNLKSDAKEFLNNIASPADDKESDYSKETTNTSELSGIFDNISEAIASQTTTEVTEKIVNITDATVVDTIDKRFKLTDETRAALQGQATVTDNEDGTTTVKWEHQTIMADGSTKYVLRVKAKADYIGGNNVATNVQDQQHQSCIITHSGATIDFDQPRVNVKVELTAKDYKTTRFAGETFNANNVESKNNKSLEEILNPRYGNDDVKTEWKDANGNTISPDAMNAITTNAQYRLELSYNAGKATKESPATIASNGHYNEENMTAKGQFEINFKKGSLTITKKINEQYTTGKTQLLALDDNDSGLAEGLKQKEGVTNDYTQSNQTFIYKIQRKVKNEVKETFYATISFDSKDTDKEKLVKSVTIHNLEQGDYTVTEETDWSRKYSLNNASTNNGTTLFSFGSKSTTDGNNLKIGYREDTTKNYFTGLDEDANENAGYVDTNDGYVEATFTKAVMKDDGSYEPNQDVHAIYTNNKKTGWYWNSDAAIAINKYN